MLNKAKVIYITFIIRYVLRFYPLFIFFSQLIIGLFFRWLLCDDHILEISMRESKANNFVFNTYTIDKLNTTFNLKETVYSILSIPNKLISLYKETKPLGNPCLSTKAVNLSNLDMEKFISLPTHHQKAIVETSLPLNYQRSLPYDYQHVPIIPNITQENFLQRTFDLTARNDINLSWLWEKLGINSKVTPIAPYQTEVDGQLDIVVDSFATLTNQSIPKHILNKSNVGMFDSNYTIYLHKNKTPGHKIYFQPFNDTLAQHSKLLYNVRNLSWKVQEINNCQFIVYDLPTGEKPLNLYVFSPQLEKQLLFSLFDDKPAHQKYLPLIRRLVCDTSWFREHLTEMPPLYDLKYYMDTFQNPLLGKKGRIVNLANVRYYPELSAKLLDLVRECTFNTMCQRLLVATEPKEIPNRLFLEHCITKVNHLVTISSPDKTTKGELKEVDLWQIVRSCNLGICSDIRRTFCKTVPQILSHEIAHIDDNGVIKILGPLEYERCIFMQLIPRELLESSLAKTLFKYDIYNYMDHMVKTKHAYIALIKTVDSSNTVPYSLFEISYPMRNDYTSKVWQLLDEDNFYAMFDKFVSIDLNDPKKRVLYADYSSFRHMQKESLDLLFQKKYIFSKSMKEDITSALFGFCNEIAFNKDCLRLRELLEPKVVYTKENINDALASYNKLRYLKGYLHFQNVVTTSEPQNVIDPELPITFKNERTHEFYKKLTDKNNFEAIDINKDKLNMLQEASGINQNTVNRLSSLFQKKLSK